MDKTYNIAIWLDDWLIKRLQMDPQAAVYLKAGILFVVLIILCAIVWFLMKKVVVRGINGIFLKTKATWDDVLVEKRVFDKLAHIGPAIVVNGAAPYIFGDFPSLIPGVILVTDIFIIAVVIWSIGSVLTSINDILSNIPSLKDKPIASYTQLSKILVYLIGGVLIFSLLFGQSPLAILGAMGAFAAVLLLIFKDSILGFVASIQMSVYDMIRVGDWVSMPKFDADGDVLAINLTTVKVQNWDKTITTIPTYAFISDSFKNWRGMSDSGGRRIKRSLHIKMTSIKFCDDEMVTRFKRYQLVKDFVISRQDEIAKYNSELGVDKTELINGRHMTNIGVFRRYCLEYLTANKKLNHEMTTMVRHLEPTEKGLPIEIYCFSSDKNWVVYEGVMADIFDHLFAALPWFDLEIFEAPTGRDIREVAGLLKN